MSRRSVTGVLTVLALAVVIMASSLATAQTDCTQFNQPFGPFTSGHSDGNQHLTGVHSSGFSGSGSCTYSGTGACSVVAVASESNPVYDDTGIVPLAFHVPASTVSGGYGAAAGGGPAQAHAMGAVTFKSCVTAFCSVSISLGGSGSTGYSVNFPSDQVWGDSMPVDINCGGRSSSPGGGGGCGNGTGRAGSCGASPVIFDTGSVGMEKVFSDPQTDCVLFDIVGDGKPLCVSWPLVGSGGAWLVLPDKHHSVTSIAQLFGTNTPQPNHPSTAPNGFLALAEWDLPSNGGNWDLMINKDDAVWNRLRLWIDTQCRIHPDVPCTADPSDLHTLEEFGIENISLMYYAPEVYVDQYHNNFRLATHLNVKPNKLQEAAADSRTAFDVYLQAKQ